MVTTDSGDSKKETVKKVFSLSKQEILYLAIIIMLGISIFFLASLIEPLHNLGDKLAENQEVAIKLAKILIAKQNQTQAMLAEISP
jgi:hypothetical protein